MKTKQPTSKSYELQQATVVTAAGHEVIMRALGGRSKTGGAAPGRGKIDQRGRPKPQGKGKDGALTYFSGHRKDHENLC